MSAPAAAPERLLDPPLRVGISSCLLGEEVRFNGGHKRDRFLTDLLGSYVEWFPVCPEVEIGMGVPRESIRLAERDGLVRLVAPKSGTDYTEQMSSWAEEKLAEIASWKLHGYVLKKGSPSCGAFRVRVYAENGMPSHGGRGLFAHRLMKRFPLLPVEEEGRLNDLPLRENFIERLFVHERWRRLLAEDPTPRGLVRFHTEHKLAVLAHSPAHYRRLGRLVADAGTRDWGELSDEYAALLAEALQQRASRGRHANALEHVIGFLKHHVDGTDRAELVELIGDYRVGTVPLIVPITLINHHLRRHKLPDWIYRQTYLRPYPKELMLRNHV